MQEVVTGVQLEMVRETLLASLHVNPDALQIFRLGSAYQPEVRLSKDRKHGDRLAWIGVGVSESGGPRILVVARQWWSILREDQSQSPAPDQVRVGQVRQDMSNRPLPRCFRPSHDNTGRGPDHFLE